MKFSPGMKLINRYEIKNFHAAGGMQEVYYCYDHALERYVALKTPKDGVSDRRFQRGAEMGARVVHANVAATFDYYEDDHITFMVEEFIDGVDLGYRLSNEFYFMDPALAAKVIHHIVRAVCEAHKVGICHRDLKPSNIMTSKDPGVKFIKLTDFGIAKLAESEMAAEIELFGRNEATLTTSNTLLGAVPYMAPECWENWKSAGLPMDIWAMGCIAYQLLTGEPPFGSGIKAIRNVAMLQARAVSLKKPLWFGTRKVTEKLENALWEIIISCLKHDPSDRPTAQNLLQACDNLLYASSDRRMGVVQKYGGDYENGSAKKYGYISDPVTGEEFFFHQTAFFGKNAVQKGQPVSFSVYPGTPAQRASPILEMKP